MPPSDPPVSRPGRDHLVARLRAAGCVAAEAEADEMLAAAPDLASVEHMLARRERGEPLAWIVGAATFGDRRLRVDPGVYVPRPQTEELARRAAGLLPATGCAVDLCTGSGAVAAHLRAVHPSARIVGVDVDPIAVRTARANGVATVRADVRALPLRGPVDLVTAVTPYVPAPAIGLLPADVQRWEPRRSHDGGADGLDVTRAVARAAGRLLRPGGWLLVELGGDQAVRLAPDLAEAGFAPAERWTDDDGDLRGLAARRQV